MMYRPTATLNLFVLYTVHIPASYRFTVRICAGLGPIATFRLCFLFFPYLTCKLIRFLRKVFCYYSSAVVRSFQYLWSAVVTILLRTRASCRHVLVYHMCDLGLQSM